MRKRRKKSAAYHPEEKSFRSGGGKLEVCYLGPRIRRDLEEAERSIDEAARYSRNEIMSRLLLKKYYIKIQGN